MITPNEILSILLNLELRSNASKLKFIDEGFDDGLDEDFLIESISVLNELSIRNDELSKKQLIGISSLLWTYRNPSWSGLKDYLILFLSRAGFGPTSVMADPEYSPLEKTYSFSESLINQFAVTLAHLKNEVIVGEKLFLLSDFQKEIWEAVDTNQLLGISAPTSAGKSFVILLKAIDLLIKKEGVVIYVVPTLSLVTQVLIDFRNALNEFGLLDYPLESTFSGSFMPDNAIYVLTQEKAISAFSQKNIPFQNIRLLIIDEIQNVERVADSDDQRSKVLFDLMIELRNTSNIDHIIISGPRIVNIDKLGTSIFGINSEKKETDASPVFNLTYSISKKRSKFYLQVHSELLENSCEVEITNKNQIQGYGNVLYNDKFLGYLSLLIDNFYSEESNLIFSPTSPTCSKIADYIADLKSEIDDSYLRELSNFIASTIHPEYGLVNTVKKGVAYHHGKLPSHVRLLVEDGIKNKSIKTVACTTTLLQGVNLPVQNIIIRNPNLFIRDIEGSVKLSNYELANLRGRAGRLLKDFIGRTYMLDESSFIDEEGKQLELFKDESKELSVGYSAKYKENREKIEFDLLNGIGKTASNEDYSFLTTYIRQVVFKYKNNSRIYLERVGINIDEPQLNTILQLLISLEVSEELCSRNRYWDPIDLNKLYLINDTIEIPTSASEENISYKLRKLVLFFKIEFPIYYEKYFGINEHEGSNKILSVCIMAENWLKEKSLFDIFSNQFYANSKQIEEAIGLIQNKISYGLPLLLKPLYDIKEPEGMFIRFVEMGAYTPLVRRFIELNIPRETAIYLNKNFSFQEIENKQALINQLREIKKDLSYWYKIQLNTI
ncbi:MAG: DEAD/DEAH box helicase [Bacteroidetes bacterium]|nr:DEAD/DEAH box helicase [Bacteroidota bacterium]